MTPPRGFTRKDGACNTPVDIGLIRPGYCHRPDNGSGLCNVHQAARERGRRQRKANIARRLRLVNRTKGPTP